MVPTENDDLVEHLKYWAFKFCGRGDKENIASDVMTKAWEEIERLRKKNERLREALQKIADAKIPGVIDDGYDIMGWILKHRTILVDKARAALRG
jgi:hypothetical protein